MNAGYNHHEFVPYFGLRNRHLMTIAPALYQRRFPLVESSVTERHFEVEPGSHVLAHCHWSSQPKSAPTLIILHGLEGCSDSHYVLGSAEKALALGMNVVRMNMRNCGDTMHLTPTLYNSGLSADVMAVVNELRLNDGLEQIYLAGFSMGGNIVLKAAAECESSEVLAGVVAISPSLDLAPCVDELERGFNQIYQLRFLHGLKNKIRSKHKLYPDLYDTRLLRSIRSVRAFDDAYTAPLSGYGNAANYYRLASALPLLDRIAVPTLIVQAQDDPFVPFASFNAPQFKNPHIHLLSPAYGGHNGFLQRQAEEPPVFDRFWAENRLVKFCLVQSLR